ncbi:hypothetical protein M758_3G216000 [Ceratodon purpureus]|nr:hypothetical protein M758_3G216000 [Ceratodon purpureus]
MYQNKRTIKIHHLYYVAMPGFALRGLGLRLNDCKTEASIQSRSELNTLFSQTGYTESARRTYTQKNFSVRKIKVDLTQLAESISKP